jgi:hypothetical protein
MVKILGNVVWLALLLALALNVSISYASAQAASSADPHQLPRQFLQNAVPRTFHARLAKNGGTTKNGPTTFASTASVAGIDSVANWTGQFTAAGFDGNNNPQSVWPYAMVGTAPESGVTTTISAPIVPVTVRLLDKDGHVARTANGTRLILRSRSTLAQAVVNSPIFQPFVYTSGIGQYNDQMQRAEFWNRTHHGTNHWHTLLSPSVKTGRTMDIPYGFWYYGLNDDGSIAHFLVDANTFVGLLFPPTYPVDNTTVIGAAELAGDITTHDISTFLVNNVYLYDGTPDQCCILGFHSADLEPGIPSNGNLLRLYIMNFSSWVSPGLFRSGAADVTPLSHELAETFNDPFGNNLTPWWLSVDRLTGSGQCQNVMEVGDVVEVLTALPIFAVPMNGRTYHVQNEALLPWFEFQSPSSAHLAAYSFPDEDTLLSLSPGPLHAGCTP